MDPEIEQRNALVLSCQGYVRQIARAYLGRGLDLDDLISHGQLGLIRAAEKFDPARGYQFTTYANCWIRQFIQRGIDTESRTIHVPVYVLNSVRSWRQDPAQPKPWQAEAVEWARCKTSDLATVLAAIEPGVRHEDSGDIERLRQALGRLSERDRTILLDRYGLDGRMPLTIRAISQREGVAKECMRQRIDRAVRRLAVLLDAPTRPVTHHGRRIRTVTLPCVDCGDPDGKIARGKLTPRRIDGARFGFDGDLCHHCYRKHEKRDHRARARRQRVAS